MSEVDAQHKAFLILLLHATGLLSHVAKLGLNASAARTVVQCLYGFKEAAWNQFVLNRSS